MLLDKTFLDLFFVIHALFIGNRYLTFVVLRDSENWRVLMWEIRRFIREIGLNFLFSLEKDVKEDAFIY